MVLLDVYVEQMTSGEVLATLGTTVDMGLEIMDLVILVGCERERLGVRR